MKNDEVEDIPEVIIGAFSIHSYRASVLFDSKASHWFVTPDIVDKLKLYTYRYRFYFETFV